MASGPDYYATLGIEPTLDADVIEAAYRSRSLPHRVGQLRRRADESAGPTQEELEEAYHILSNPQSRLLYYQARFPDRPLPKPTRRGRLPVWLRALIAVWLVAILGVGYVGIRSRITTDGGVIGQIVQTPTVVAAASGARTAQASGGAVPTSGSAAVSTAAPLQPLPTLTASSSAAGTAAPPLTGRSTVTTGAAVTAAATGTARGGATAGASATGVSATVAPPTATATAPPPTATAVPPVAVAPTEPPPAPPPPAPPPPPEPTPTIGPPPFVATDRIGTALSVNLRNGPGANYPSLGLLPTGTLLRATGETAYSGGQLWRRFALQDGRRGWVRDLDVFAVR